MNPHRKSAGLGRLIFEVEEQKRFFTIIIIAAIVAGGAISLTYMTYNEMDILGIRLMLVSLTSLILALVLVQLGKLRAVAWVFIFGIGGTIFLASLFRDGVLNPAYDGLLLIIIASAFLLNSQASIKAAVVIGAGTILLTIAQLAGVVPFQERTTDPILSVAIMHLLFIFLTAVIVWRILSQLRHSLEEAEKKTNALLESETRIRALVEGYFEAIGISVDGIVVEANQALATLLGYEHPAQLIGLPLKNLHTQRSNKFIRHVVETGMETPYEVQIERPDGVVFPAEVLGRNAIYMGKPARIVALRDLTLLRETEKQLWQAQKVDSLGVMAGAIAHDFNNLLMAIMGQASVAKAKLPADSRAQPHMEKCLKATQKAANLTKQLLAYSGKGHFIIKPVDMNGLIQENLSLLDIAAQHSVHICLELAPNLPMIQADEVQIQQLLINLLLNAVEAGEGQTQQIRIETSLYMLTSPSTQFGMAVNQPLPSGRYVSLRIADDGPGMPPEILEHIFEPFFSTKGTGRGLGLAAILGIVRGHQGGLMVQSAPGQGASFTFLFPIEVDAFSASKKRPL